ncbi:MAG: hypothetical protein ACRECP_12590 [Methylocella sp.]
MVSGIQHGAGLPPRHMQKSPVKAAENFSLDTNGNALDLYSLPQMQVRQSLIANASVS